MIKNISNLGDAAVYCDFGEEINREINLNVVNYFRAIKEKKINGIINLTPSYNKLIISIDLNITNYEKIAKKIQEIQIYKNVEKKGEKIKVPICCEQGFALDFNRLEKKLNLTRDQILDTFFSKEYFCYMNGFIAGMPFMGDIDISLRLERLKTPRVKVPKGSIGITEQFCNIYTFESPGGWNIIGNTPLNIFDKNNIQSPVRINPGDLVQFYRISNREYDEY